MFKRFSAGSCQTCSSPCLELAQDSGSNRALENTKQPAVVRAELACLDAARFRRWHPHSNMRCVVLGTTGPSNQHNSKGCNGHHRDQQKPHASRRLLHQFWLEIRPTEGALLATHPINIFFIRSINRGVEPSNPSPIDLSENNSQ